MRIEEGEIAVPSQIEEVVHNLEVEDLDDGENKRVNELTWSQVKNFIGSQLSKNEITQGDMMQQFDLIEGLKDNSLEIGSQGNSRG